MWRFAPCVLVLVAIASYACAAPSVAGEDVPCRAPPPSSLLQHRVRFEEQYLSARGFHPLSAPAEHKRAAAEAFYHQHPEHRRQGSDGITRTTGNCFRTDASPCDLCCNGWCCELLEPSIARTAQLFPSTVTGANPTEQLWVPVRFVLVAPQPVPEVNMTKAREQLVILNRAFYRIGIWFHFDSFEYFNDTRMVAACNTDPCYVSEDCDFYTYLTPRVKGNNERVITYVMCDLPYLGEAQWPWYSEEDDPRQYIQIAYKVLGFGSRWYNPPGGGSGTTGIHEMGHYFGLLHTFEREGVCDMEGDWVADTPSSRERATRTEPCNFERDSCPQQDGLDDENNWMNYARDECSQHFTPLQYERIQRGFRRYRPRLYANSLVPGICPQTAEDVSECRCTDPAQSPQDHCGGTPVPAPPTPEPATPAPPISGVNLALVIGLVVGGVVLVTAAVVAACVLRTKAQREGAEVTPNEPSQSELESAVVPTSDGPAAETAIAEAQEEREVTSPALDEAAPAPEASNRRGPSGGYSDAEEGAS